MSFSPLPPHYDEVTGQTDIKTGEQPSYGHSPWLLRRTSIRVESTPNEAYYDDRSSNRDPSIKSNDEKGAIRNLMTRFGSRQGEELIEEGKSFMSQGQDQYEFGTKVSIEASNPLKAQTRQRHEMKGLEQAASVKRWPGGGSPAEAWGKLAKVNIQFA